MNSTGSTASGGIIATVPSSGASSARIHGTVPMASASSRPPAALIASAQPMRLRLAPGVGPQQVLAAARVLGEGVVVDAVPHAAEGRQQLVIGFWARRSCEASTYNHQQGHERQHAEREARGAYRMLVDQSPQGRSITMDFAAQSLPSAAIFM